KDKLEMNIVRYFYYPNSKELQSSMKQASIMEITGYNHTTQLGMDFYLTPKQTLGFVANGSFNKGDWNSHSPVYFLDEAKRIDSLSTSNNHIGYDWKNGGINLHYKIEMGEGSSLTTNLDYNHFYIAMPQSL